MAHDVDRLFLAPSRKIDANTIVTLQDNLDKAVEGLGRIIVALSLSEERGYGGSAKRIAQSLIKELRT